MKKIYWLFIFVQSISDISAQKHGYTWVFGYENNNDPNSDFGGAIVDFNETTPTSKKDTRKVSSSSYSGACSDSSGQLLFYTNGIAIHNYQHELIENGDSINSGSIWDQSKNNGYPSPYGAFALVY